MNTRKMYVGVQRLQTEVGDKDMWMWTFLLV